MMSFSFSRHALRWKLALVICFKICFLYALWQVVLQYQITHVDTSQMSDHLMSPQTTSTNR